MGLAQKFHLNTFLTPPLNFTGGGVKSAKFGRRFARALVSKRSYRHVHILSLTSNSAISQRNRAAGWGLEQLKQRTLLVLGSLETPWWISILVIKELFWLGVTVEALLYERILIGSRRFKGWASLAQNFRCLPPTILRVPKLDGQPFHVA